MEFQTIHPTTMKNIVVCFMSFIALPSCGPLVRSSVVVHELFPPKPSAEQELVMHDGDCIEATTRTGSIKIEAGKGLRRSYTWENATRTTALIPREERWNGSLGAYFPGPGNHWKNHGGITRGVLQEGQQHFSSMGEVTNWLARKSSFIPTVYNDDGLVVSFGKVSERHQVNIEVWQIYINRAKPGGIPGSGNRLISRK